MADDEQKVEHINLKVAGQDGSVVQFKIKKVGKSTIIFLTSFIAHTPAQTHASVLRSSGTPAESRQIPIRRKPCEGMIRDFSFP